MKEMTKDSESIFIHTEDMDKLLDGGRKHRFSKLEMYFDLLRLANRNNESISYIFNERKISVKRGELAMGLSELASRWSTTKSSALDKLRELECSKLIKTYLFDDRLFPFAKVEIINYNFIKE